MNGASTQSEGLTPAQRMAAQHAAQEENHRPQVEEVEDEEDVAHPVPSAHPESAPAARQPVLSDIAQGKQKMADAAHPKKSNALNTGDEEAFPSLGPAKAPTAAPGWGKKPAIASMNTPKSVVNGSSNGESKSELATLRLIDMLTLIQDPP